MDTITREKALSTLKKILDLSYTESESQLILQSAWEHIASYPVGEHDRVYRQIKEDLLRCRPIQYITGKSYFSDFELYVAEGVLIPRPETDELADWIIRDCQSIHQPTGIWDIGTGSGCIAIALKRKIRSAVVYASDISTEALTIARYNAAKLGTEIHFFRDDILNDGPRSLPGMDIIVSNPPYILPEEINDMEAHVSGHEPHLALFVRDDDPLQFYKAIEKTARRQLKNSGILYLELHSLYAAPAQLYFEQHQWRTTLRQDMQGKARMLKCIFNNTSN
ncbi:MAG: peptide chain release factor N(5)-glutamine methyltransferase [Taibaiella sp.]|nr:peptide chain release factor N(5)-glutamine methyltransferase [Taibaiella sp.]